MPDLPPLLGGRVQRDESIEQALTQALDQRARQVKPGDRFSDVLDRMLETEREEPRAGFRTVLVASLLALAVGLALPLLFRRTPPTAVAPIPATPSQVVSQPAGPPSLLTQQKRVSVYYLGADGLLYREFHDLPTQDDRLTTAVAAVLNVVPHDPSLGSQWAGGQVNSTKVEGNRIIIDISAAAFAGFTSRGAATQAVNQIVYTAIAAVGDSYGERSVQILRDGSPNLPLLGAPATDFVREGTLPLAPLMIDEPSDAEVQPAGQLRAIGWQKVDLPQTTVSWQVLRDGKTIKEGAVKASGNHAGWRLWRVQVPLPAGRYVLRVETVGSHPLERSVTLA